MSHKRLLKTWITIEIVLCLAVKESYGAYYECGRTKGYGTTIDAHRSTSGKNAVSSTKWANNFDAQAPNSSYDNLYGITGQRSGSGGALVLHYNTSSWAKMIVNQEGKPHIQTFEEMKEALLARPKVNPKVIDDTSYANATPLYTLPRYEAAARATDNYYDSCTFYSNYVQRNIPLTGIVYVNFDLTKSCPAYGYTAGNYFTPITWSSGSIHVNGTLVTDVYHPKLPIPPEFNINVPMNINPIKGPSSNSVVLTPKDYESFRDQAIAGTFNPQGGSSPYEVAWRTLLPASGSSNPIGKDLSKYGDFDPFTSKERPAAWVHRGRYVRLQNSANINGVVSVRASSFHFWNPSLPCTANPVGFINGALVGGVQVTFTEHAAGGGIFISFDPQTINKPGDLTPSDTVKVGYWTD